MFRYNYLILSLLLVFTLQVSAQSVISDSSMYKKFPFVIGNIGFAIDSIDVVVGDVPRGEVSEFNIGVYNFGKESVEFTGGNSNRFVTLKYSPASLLPLSEGFMNIEFNADVDLLLGDYESEISITSNDKKNPSKFLYLLMNIVESTQGAEYQKMLDTVPHIVFDHYNYEYGHLVRGGKQYHTFLVSNGGSEPLHIFDIEVPDGIKLIDSPVQAIMPGEETIIRVRINTKGRVGIQHQSVLVRSNDPINPLIILGLHGSVRIYPEHKKTSDQCNENRQRF